MTAVPSLKDLRVGIVGGGIGGLHAAAALLASGAHVEVFEQASALGDIGAGIQLSPNASRLLVRMGLGPALEAIAVRPSAIVQRRWCDGAELSRVPLGRVEERYGAPYLHVHRADLIDALASAVPRSALRLGERVVAVANRGAGTETETAEVETAEGARHRFDVVIGADGIHSVVRRHVIDRPTAPRFSGHVAYRALVPAVVAAELGFEVDVTNWLGPGGHLVHYFVRAQTMFNIVAVITSDWQVESWHEQGEVDELRAAFSGWAPMIEELLARVTHTHRWALFDRDPLDRWVNGRLVLLGDSCHPMLPYVAQGGAQAIEDGAALGAALITHDGVVPDALRAYEMLRVQRAGSVQAAARANGVLYHLPDGPDQVARDARLAERSRQSVEAFAELWSHDAGSC